MSARSALRERGTALSVTQPFVRPASLIALLLNAIVAVSCGAAAVAAAASTAQSIVAECGRSDSDAVGLTELQEDCPGLEHALVELGYAPFISERQAETLTVHSLVDLQELARRYHEPPRVEAVPDVAKLAPILDSLQQQQRAQAPQGWFARFKQWLRDLFERHTGQKPADSWFERWWSDHPLSERWSNIITYGLIGLVLLLAMTVIVNEVRAGWTKGGVRRRAQPADGAVLPAMTRFTLADLDSVAPALRPALMLQALVNALLDADRLRADRSLTHRELSSRAIFDSAEQRDGFGRIARLGERLLYGAAPASMEEIEAALATGRALRTELAVPVSPRMSPRIQTDSAASGRPPQPPSPSQAQSQAQAQTPLAGGPEGTP